MATPNKETVEKLRTLMQDGSFIPEIWSRELMKKMVDATVLGGMAKHTIRIPDPVMPCSLSKAIVLDALVELMGLQPDLHLSQILSQVDECVHDTDFAKSISELVCSLRPSCTNDSSSETPPTDSTSRTSPHSTGPSGDVLRVRHPCEPSPPSHALDALGYALPYPSSPLSQRGTFDSKRR